MILEHLLDSHDDVCTALLDQSMCKNSNYNLRSSLTECSGYPDLCLNVFRPYLYHV